MIIVHIKAKAFPEKRKELLQTIQAISNLTREEKGCVSHRLFQEVENRNSFSLIEEWETRKDLENRLKSDAFSVLLGAFNLLSERPEMKFSTVTDISGLEATKALKGM